MSEQAAERATVTVAVTPATKAELDRRAAEFYAVHQVRPSMDAVIRQALADRKPATP